MASSASSGTTVSRVRLRPRRRPRLAEEAGRGKRRVQHEARRAGRRPADPVVGQVGEPGRGRRGRTSGRRPAPRAERTKRAQRRVAAAPAGRRRGVLVLEPVALRAARGRPAGRPSARRPVDPASSRRRTLRCTAGRVAEDGGRARARRGAARPRRRRPRARADSRSATASAEHRVRRDLDEHVVAGVRRARSPRCRRAPGGRGSTPSTPRRGRSPSTGGPVTVEIIGQGGRPSAAGPNSAAAVPRRRGSISGLCEANSTDSRTRQKTPSASRAAAERLQRRRPRRRSTVESGPLAAATQTRPGSQLGEDRARPRSSGRPATAIRPWPAPRGSPGRGAGRRRRASSSSSAPATWAAATSPTLWPTTAAGSTPQDRHSAASAICTAQSAAGRRPCRSAWTRRSA